MLTRRELGKLALAVPAAGVLARTESIFGALREHRRGWEARLEEMRRERRAALEAYRARPAKP